jgi:glycosyltransferase involved in cell wall biosynthesis
VSGKTQKNGRQVMIYLAYIILIIAGMRFLIALVNLIFDPRLKSLRSDNRPLISVLVPARNEETNIGTLLNDLREQDYSNIEIIVYDDNSTDNTKLVIEKAAEIDDRLKLITAKPLPQGWLGKNYGCHLLAQQAIGELYLFLDADVRIKDGLLESGVEHLQKHDLGLLSIFPKQIMKSAGEQMVVPLMNIILLTLLPLILVRVSKKPALAAANGQFMLFNSTVYRKIQPHFVLKNNRVEDIAITRIFKKEKIKIDCLIGNPAISCRMYKKYNEAIVGFSKNLTAFFGNSWFLSVLFWMITTFGILLLGVFLPIRLIVVYIALALLTRIFVSLISAQSIFKNILFLIPQLIALGHLNFKAIINSFFREYTWKERIID